MLYPQEIEQIKNEIRNFFKKMTLSVEIKETVQKDQALYLNVKVKEPKLLIGEKGFTLLEIQKVLRAILRKKIPKTFYLDLDINSYKKKKIEYLKETARTIADEVALTKKEKILSPMPAYERRIIHLEIAERGDVTSESIGEEPERRVVIKPYP
jgi:spoIIIJ-associated protein